MKKTICKHIFLILCLMLTSIIYSNEELTVKYYNNVFGGGKERIECRNGNFDKVIISNVNMNIDLYENYSIIKIDYMLKNNGENVDLLFKYPCLDANINKKITETKTKTSTKFIKSQNKGNYLNFNIKVDTKDLSYDLIENINDNELIAQQFKTGNTQCYIIDEKRKQEAYEETIDSFFYSYSWYVVPINIQKSSNKLISISYITPHYYSEILANKCDTYKFEEDPALKYLSLHEQDSQHYISEKVFNYFFNTMYSDKEKIIKNLIIKLKVNLITQAYADIFPKNYRKTYNNYMWKYRNFKANQENNIEIKLSSLNSKKAVDLLKFDIKPNKKFSDYESYYDVNKTNNEIILNFQKENSEKIYVKEVRLAGYYNNSSLSEKNLPYEFEIYFSEQSDFNNSIKIIKKYPVKKVLSIFNRDAYLTLYKGRAIKCKFIKIKLLKSTKNLTDDIRISDIGVFQ